MKRTLKLFLFFFMLTVPFMVNVNAADPSQDPVIYFNGGKYMEITQGGSYIEQGVFAIDAQDGYITDYEVQGEVDTFQPGQYILTYSVEDSDGNRGIESRLVVVTPFGQDLDTTPQDVFSIGEVLNWGGDSSDVITASTETSDGGFVIVVQVETSEVVGNPIADYIGIQNNNVSLDNLSNVIVKYDSNYKVVWAEIIGSAIDDRINDIQEISANTFIFVGNSGSYGNGGSLNTAYQNITITDTGSGVVENEANGMDGILGKFTYSTQVTMDWVNNIYVDTQPETYNKQINNFIIDDDGSIVIAGSIVRNNGADEAFFQKYDSSGNYVTQFIDPTSGNDYRSINGRVLKLSSGYMFFTYADYEVHKSVMRTAVLTTENVNARAIKINDAMDTVAWNVVTDRMNVKDAIVASDGDIIIVGDDISSAEVGTYNNTHGSVYPDPIHSYQQYSSSIVMKLDESDGSRVWGYYVGGELDQTSNNSSYEDYSNYKDRIFDIVEDSSNNYILFGKTRSEGSYETDSTNPFDDTYSIWAVAFTDDTVGDTITFNSNTSLHSNLDADYATVIDLGGKYLATYYSEGQYGISVRDNDDYNADSENDVFMVEFDLTNSSSVDFTAPVVEETVTIDEDLAITDVEDLVDDSTGVIAADNDIDVLYDGAGSLTYLFDETNFDHTVPGVYTVPYFIYDNNKNATSGDLTITINDITPPVLTFSRLEIEVGSNPDFLEGVILTDEGDDTLTLNDIVIDEGDFDEDVIDDYDITYTVTDASGNERVAVRRVEVVDEIGLVIEFEGDLIVEVGTLLPDYLDGVDLSANRGVSVSLTDVSVNTASVNLLEVGTYTVKYTVDNGNQRGDNTRFVRVVDTKGPVFTVNTDKDTTLPVDSEVPNWLEYVNVTDSYDSNPEVTFVTDVAFHITGDYLVVYTARDSEGNESYYQLEITVGDLTAPSIELKGDLEINVEVFTTYEEMGYMVTDNYNVADDITVEVVDEIIYTNGNVDTVGTYRIKYTAVDASGNRSETVERIVNVVDLTPPTIEGIEFKEAVRTEEIDFLEGIVIKDNYDEEIVIKPEDITRVADLSKPNGNYIVTITARDSSGNATSFSYGLYIVNEDAQVSAYIMGAAVVILLGGGILMATRKQ